MLDAAGYVMQGDQDALYAFDKAALSLCFVAVNNYRTSAEVWRILRREFTLEDLACNLCNANVDV